MVMVAPQPSYSSEADNESYKEIITKLNDTVSKHSPAVMSAVSKRTPNLQFFEFQEIVTELNQLFETDGLLHDQVKSSLGLTAYYNLIKNHLLHISLTNQIMPFDNLAHMYPHDLPYRHEGPYPILPTWQVLRRTLNFFSTLTHAAETVQNLSLIHI